MRRIEGETSRVRRWDESRIHRLEFEGKMIITSPTSQKITAMDLPVMDASRNAVLEAKWKRNVGGEVVCWK